jgi:hypothetical protein
MAGNFKISVCRNNHTLHVKLMGDFDGTSAHQLLNCLKKHCNGSLSISAHDGKRQTMLSDSLLMHSTTIYEHTQLPLVDDSFKI